MALASWRLSFNLQGRTASRMASRKTWELFTLGPWRGTWRPALEGHAASELALAAWPQAGRGGRHSGGDVGSEALKFTPRARTAGPEQTALALAGLRTVDFFHPMGSYACYRIIYIGI